MKQNKNKGYTIMEAMIFLAVSSVIFVSVALLISGQTAKYQARDAVNQAESVVRGVLNDVGNGYFPLVGKTISCRAGDTKPIFSSIVGTDNRGTQTGANGCMIAGKSIEFRNNDIYIQTWAVNGSLTNPPSYSQLTPISPDLDEIKNYKWGLTPDNPGQKYYVLYGNYTISIGGTGDFKSGSQNMVIKQEQSGSFVDVYNGAGNNKICFSNGRLKSSLYIADYSLNLEPNYDDTSC